LSKRLDAPAPSFDWVLVFLAALPAIRFAAAMALRGQFTGAWVYGAM
jgi:hypothetical protein